MSDKDTWLAGLKVGDLVWVRLSTGKNAWFQWVARFTKTRIVTDDGMWYRRKDGRRIARCGCCFQSIERPTAAQVREAKR